MSAVPTIRSPEGYTVLGVCYYVESQTVKARLYPVLVLTASFSSLLSRKIRGERYPNYSDNSVVKI